MRMSIPHYQPTGERMAVAMSYVFAEIGYPESRIEPVQKGLKGLIVEWDVPGVPTLVVGRQRMRRSKST